MKSISRISKSRLTRYTMVGVLAGLCMAITVTPLAAHGIFKKTLEKKYKAEGLRVTCNMCHVKGEAKTERNEVGQVFFKQLEGQDLSARWDASEGDERKQRWRTT